DGEGPRRSYFVLAAVTPANLAAVVVLDDVVVAQLLVQRQRAGRHSLVAGDEWENGRLDRRDLRVEAEDDALAVADDLLVVGVAEERHEDALDTDRGLDHVRRVTSAVGVDPLELRARVLCVLREVIVAAVGDALQFLPADRVEVLDVARCGGVVRALRLVVLTHPEIDLAEAEAAVPRDPLLE